ncbi:transcription factor tga1 [Phtheirospermum japonicum]|uniref:Transcription factor tga1 n=1 Tax=Phtheirospermum japonicum TaxID=374723 RepID=A0A830D5U2_9LAMI|nr:transcription factor tga1 [Phtheirospermum japonicum]
MSNIEHESFSRFFDNWIAQQQQYLGDLISISSQHPDETMLRGLVERVVQHYEGYYVAKSRWAADHILSMFRPPWLSTLEDAFLWIAGWRPTTAVQLLFSKTGLEIEARGDISQAQLRMADELQREIAREENAITELMAAQQEKVAHREIVDLSHDVTEMIRAGHSGEDSRVDPALRSFKDEVVRILQMADDLRLRTLKAVIDILTPLQGVHYLIAAAELHLRVHEWGKERDAKRQAAAAAHGHGEHK